MPTAEPASDGRRARRDHNRAAVVDAMFQLLEEGVVPPGTEAIAERAGVSVSSVFRYFESIDDLQRETIDRYFERFAPLFEIPSRGIGPLDERIARLVDARIRLYGSIAPIARLARARATEHPRIAESLRQTRSLFVTQVRSHFAPELQPLPRTRADDLVALIDGLTAFESWDLQRAGHRRSDRLIGRAWAAGIHALVHGLGPEGEHISTGSDAHQRTQ